MVYMLGYKQERVLAAVGADGTVFTSNGEYAEWSEPEVTDADLALKANANNPVFTGTVTVPDGALAIADTSGLQSALDLKAPLASPTFTGTVVLPNVSVTSNITSNSVVITPTELGYVGTLTSDAQTQINAKANAANPVFTGTVTIPDGALAIADTSGLQAALDAKAPTASPTFTGTVTLPSGQSIANVVLTGTVTVPDSALAIADTSGLQTALDGKVDVSGETMTGTLGVQVSANPALNVVQAGGNNVMFVRTDVPLVSLSNGAAFTIFSDNAFSSATFTVDGATGGTTIAGAAHIVGNIELDGALNHDGTTVGFFGTTPATQPAANADTSGASLATLETEVNQIKAALRSLGIIAT